MYVRYVQLIHEARQYTLATRDELVAWCNVNTTEGGRQLLNLQLPTRHGFIEVHVGDYVIKVDDNTFWAVPETTFNKLFREVQPEELDQAESGLSFSIRLKRIRTRKGISQALLSGLSGIPVSTISHYESARRLPSMKNTARLAEALGVSTDALFGRKAKE